jgi:hypothetical protein
MKRTSRWFPGSIKRLNPHSVGVVGEPDCDQAGFYSFIHGTSNCARKIGLDLPLKRDFPRDKILIQSFQFTLFDQVSTRNGPVCLNDASESALEFSHDLNSLRIASPQFAKQWATLTGLLG